MTTAKTDPVQTIITSVHDLFQTALRRPRLKMLYPGPIIKDEDGALACFAVTVENGIVTSVEYRCSTCATLVAVCEWLRQQASETPAAVIASWQPDEVRTWLPEIPQSRSSRMDIALRALQSAC